MVNPVESCTSFYVGLSSRNEQRHIIEEVTSGCAHACTLYEVISYAVKNCN